jgi:hypothetical protein
VNVAQIGTLNWVNYLFLFLTIFVLWYQPIRK